MGLYHLKKISTGLIYRMRMICSGMCWCSSDLPGVVTLSCVCPGVFLGTLYHSDLVQPDVMFPRFRVLDDL